MSIDEQDLRSAFRAAADATPIPDRWEEIVAGSDRARRRRTLAMSGSAVVALAAAIAVAVVAISGLTTNRFVVSTGAVHRAAISVFPGGPTVDLVSLSNGRLAFVSGSHLFVVDAGRHTARQLTKSGDASALSWSADGAWLAFSVRNAPGYEDYTTWVTRADGSDARPLDGMSDTFRWSPTGHRLAITGFCCTSDRRGGVYVVDAGHDPRQLVAQGTQILTIAWAPDGQTVGYTAAAIYGRVKPSVWTVRADGTDRRRVGDGEVARWSPDGQSLLLGDQLPQSTSDASPGRIVLMRVADGRRHVLGTSIAASGGANPETWSAFSPRGDVVAFVTASDLAASITVCTIADAACRPLTDTNGRYISGPSFSPDGTSLTYVSDHTLRVVTLADGAVRTIDQLGTDLLQGAGDGVHVTRGAYANVPVWLTDGTILYRRGRELRIIDPATRISQRIVSPIGFSVTGAADQGLPGGTPVAESNLTSRQ